MPHQELVMDTADAERLAASWSEVLGYVELGREDEGSIEIGPPTSSAPAWTRGSGSSYCTSTSTPPIETCLRQNGPMTRSSSRAACGSSLSLWSKDSILSIGSVGSVLSIGSVGSALSVGSIGSSLSVGSIGSALSLVSVGSLQSTGSALSVQARRSLLTAGQYRALDARTTLAMLTLGGLAVVGALALRTRGAGR
jgi:hypothetical protein